jgi:S-adenosylmethionine:tRNA ribosyltransferase-isomerase
VTLLERPIEFSIPTGSDSAIPAEQRGNGRDDVRLMVAHRQSQQVEHTHFRSIVDHLRPGDGIVVNTSATIPAAVTARTRDGRMLMVHFDGPVQGGLWSVEIRTPVEGGATTPGPSLDPQSLELPSGVAVHLLARSPTTPRLWIANVAGTDDVVAYLEAHGHPIRYAPGPALPIDSYQTIFATQPGSAEMPSAGRPFTSEVVTRLVANGVAVLPLTLHAGVSSYEAHETPGPERFEVPAATARMGNEIRRSGGRLVAIGTTVARALETAADETGSIHPAQGSTDLLITPEGGVRALDGLLTGWHEPRSSHLALLEAVARRPLLQTVYDQAVEQGYFWHEFGDLLLILP